MATSEATSDQNFKILRDLANTQGQHWRRYSGRAMYGKECFAVVSDDFITEAVVLVALNADDNPDNGEREYKLFDDTRIPVDDVIRLLMGSRSDSMRLDPVYYWPQAGIVYYWPQAGIPEHFEPSPEEMDEDWDD